MQEEVSVGMIQSFILKIINMKINLKPLPYKTVILKETIKLSADLLYLFVIKVTSKYIYSIIFVELNFAI